MKHARMFILDTRDSSLTRYFSEDYVTPSPYYDQSKFTSDSVEKTGDSLSYACTIPLVSVIDGYLDIFDKSNFVIYANGKYGILNFSIVLCPQIFSNFSRVANKEIWQAIFCMNSATASVFFFIFKPTKKKKNFLLTFFGGYGDMIASKLKIPRQEIQKLTYI